MAWTYMQLCNRVLARLNEVQLTQSTFNTAVGFQQSVQGFVNDALNDIYDAELNWPFLYAQQTQTLTNYTQTYTLPSGWIDVDWESFYLLGNLTATPPWMPNKLRLLNYHDWLASVKPDDDRIVQEHTSGQGNVGSSPSFVIQNPDFATFVVSTPPDTQQTSGSAQFQITYDAWIKPTDLVNYNDTIIIPDMFSKVILDGATYYAYMFRDNVEESEPVEKKFIGGIQEMRRRLINKTDYMRSDQVTFPSDRAVG